MGNTVVEQKVHVLQLLVICRWVISRNVGVGPPHTGLCGQAARIVWISTSDRTDLGSL